MRERAAPNEGSFNWPDEPFDDPRREVARLLALNLQAAMVGHSAREVQRNSGVDARTVRRVMDGALWCDILTLARLEEYFDVDLWPGRIQG